MAAVPPQHPKPSEPRVLLIADRSEAVIQPGQPPAQMAAWFLDIPDGSDAATVAAEFVGEQGFPIGTVCRIVDLSDDSSVMETYKLDSTAFLPVP